MKELWDNIFKMIYRASSVFMRSTFNFYFSFNSYFTYNFMIFLSALYLLHNNTRGSLFCYVLVGIGLYFKNLTNVFLKFV